MLTWLAIPVLFVAAVLGIVGLPMLFVPAPVELYAGLFGAAAAIAAVTSVGIRWRASWHRLAVRWPAVGVVAALGLVLDGVTVPAYVAVLVGLPALGILAVLLFRRRESLECTLGDHFREVEAG